MRLDALAEGVRSGGLNSIMFPHDVVANAPQIISDLRSFFPPETGTFLIGPMAKLGWGTPTLVSLSLGIIIEIPGNVAIVGVLRVALPTDDAAVVVLQVSFVGAIEFDKSRGWFFASLFDSRVLFITIDGEMGLLIAFGDDAELRGLGRRLPPALHAAAAALPDARGASPSTSSTPRSRASGPRATSRSPPTRCSSAPMPRPSSASARSTSRATSPSTR